MMKFRLDPFPRFTELALNSLFNARILIFSVVVAKITLDRLYRYAVVKKKKYKKKYKQKDKLLTCA